MKSILKERLNDSGIGDSFMVSISFKIFFYGKEIDFSNLYNDSTMIL